MIYLGCHVSMKAPDYFYGSIKEALSYGANACMVYTGAPSNTKRKELADLKIEQAQALMKASGWDPKRVIIHAPYLINLANTIKPETANFGQEFLQKELVRVQAFGSKILVLHPGSSLKGDVDASIQSIIDRLNAVLDKDTSDVCIALETMAGKGSEVGSNFEQLAQIRSGIHDASRIQFCLDTCHIHDAGYDVENIDALLDTFDSVLDLDNLACIHLNDSKNVRGAHKDRHANIGQGEIGFDALYRVAHHPLLQDVTKILETPWIDGKAPYKEEIAALR